MSHQSELQASWGLFRRLGGVSYDGAARAVAFRRVEAAIQFAAAYPAWQTGIAQVVGRGMMLTGVIEVSPALRA